MKRTRLIVLFFFYAICFSSCSKIFLSVYGIKKTRPVTKEQIIDQAHRYNIEKLTIAELDTEYHALLTSVNHLQNSDQNIKACFTGKTAFDLSQPVQYMLFDRSGNMICHTTNCYAGGFPNLKWNRNGAFQQYPPKSLAPIDSSVKLSALIKYYDVIMENNKELNYDYICIIYWNFYIGRQSRRLINTVIKNQQLYAQGKAIKYIMVNDDNYFYCHKK